MPNLSCGRHVESVPENFSLRDPYWWFSEPTALKKEIKMLKEDVPNSVTVEWYVVRYDS